MLTATKELVDRLLSDGTVSNIAIRVGKYDEILGEVYSEGITDKTLFDMASVTKILSVTLISLIAIDKGILDIDEKVSKFFDVPPHYEDLKIRHLLTHTMGIGHKNLTKNNQTYDNVADFILSLCDVPPGTEVRYSCPAFILMGKILEKLYGKRLDVLFDEMVAAPLNMERTVFCPDVNIYKDINLSCYEGEQKLGDVADYNARYLGGVAGNAGVFSCILDLNLFVKAMLNNGAPLFSKNTLDKASKNYTPGMSEARGLGFLYVDERYKQTGELFPVGSIGHCGHTGTSVFFNRENGLYVIILSDATLSVRKNQGIPNHYNKVKLMRENIHNAIKEDIY